MHSTRITLFAVALSLLAIDADARCLQYEPTKVSLDGTIVTRMVPGPPGYVSIARGDLPQTVVFLELAEPICVSGSTTDRFNARSHAKVTEVQLVVDELVYGKLENRRVRATGTLFAARTPNHRTPVLLTIEFLRGLDDGDS